MDTNKHTIKLYWEQIRQYKPSFFTALIAIPAAALLIDTLLPYFLSQTIGSLAANDKDSVVRFTLLAASVGISGAIVNLVGFQALTRHEANVRVSLSDTTFAKLMQKDMRFFVNEKVGALTSRIIDFIRAHVTLQDLLIIRTLSFILSVGVGLVIVAFQSWPLAVIILALIIILIIQVKWSIKKRAPWRHERKKLNGEIHGAIADAITNNLTVKTFAGEQREIDFVSEKNKRFKKLFIKDIGFISVEGSARVALMVIVQLIAISMCAYLVFQGQMQIAIAIFALTYLQRISSQIFTLGDMLNGYDQALLEAAPLSDILRQDTIVNDKPNAQTLDGITPTITFTNTSYHYDDTDAQVLKSINLSIKAGEKVGLIGHSGAGKTTISHLLLRFSDVTGGSIKIDGHDIRDVTQLSLREHIAYVPQEPMLFHRSLRENIAYGKPDATDTEIIRAAKQANAYEFIEKLPQQYETLVGERGVKLSGGQRQRIAIARAILKNAPILILDEATSALDSESEKLIQDALERLMKGRTSIVIAHRLSTIAKLDRIIVLDQGAIVEDGTHQELLTKGGIYAKLWNHQSGGFIEE
ncbi:MAG: putative transporter ATP-binding protein [Candidatus Saccharibacteria bacterium]|nr:putative transporter ATP-binding protein [Candidatus Saccharibacteria bacterium]